MLWSLVVLLSMYIPFVHTLHRVCKLSESCLYRMATKATVDSRTRYYSSMTSTDDPPSSSTLPPSSSSSSSSSSPLLNYYSTSDEEINAILKSIGQPAYRCKQLKQWVYERGVVDFNEMNNLPTDLRTKLGEIFNFGSLNLVREQVGHMSKYIDNHYRLY